MPFCNVQVGNVYSNSDEQGGTSMKILFLFFYILFASLTASSKIYYVKGAHSYDTPKNNGFVTDVNKCSTSNNVPIDCTAHPKCGFEDGKTLFGFYRIIFSIQDVMDAAARDGEDSTIVICGVGYYQAIADEYTSLRKDPFLGNQLRVGYYNAYYDDSNTKEAELNTDLTILGVGFESQAPYLAIRLSIYKSGGRVIVKNIRNEKFVGVSNDNTLLGIHVRSAGNNPVESLMIENVSFEVSYGGDGLEVDATDNYIKNVLLTGKIVSESGFELYGNIGTIDISKANIEINSAAYLPIWIYSNTKTIKIADSTIKSFIETELCGEINPGIEIKNTNMNGALVVKNNTYYWCGCDTGDQKCLTTATVKASQFDGAMRVEGDFKALDFELKDSTIVGKDIDIIVFGSRLKSRITLENYRI